MRQPRHYYVYILGSISGTLYVGMTNNLHRRVSQQKQHEIEGFTKQYEVNRLLYWFSFDDVRNAIDREKQLKGWTREKKIALIESMNPGWEDLSRGVVRHSELREQHAIWSGKISYTVGVLRLRSG